MKRCLVPIYLVMLLCSPLLAQGPLGRIVMGGGISLIRGTRKDVREWHVGKLTEMEQEASPGIIPGFGSGVPARGRMRYTIVTPEMIYVLAS